MKEKIINEVNALVEKACSLGIQVKCRSCERAVSVVMQYGCAWSRTIIKFDNTEEKNNILLNRIKEFINEAQSRSNEEILNF